jgi:hypothetical protein
MRPWPLALALLAACSGNGDGGSGAPGEALTQRQRDSILAQSRLPGARGVGAAMRAADSIAARVQRADEIEP